MIKLSAYLTRTKQSLNDFIKSHFIANVEEFQIHCDKIEVAVTPGELRDVADIFQPLVVEVVQREVEAQSMSELLGFETTSQNVKKTKKKGR